MDNKKTAVLIEDDCSVVYLLKQILINKGIYLFHAGSIKEGLKLIHEKRPDFLFLDNELPDGLGFDNISAIHHEFPDIQIIAMTAQFVFDPKEKSLNAGANNFLGKPFTTTQVYKAMNLYLEDSKQ